eukprot:8008546-Alexandrium_andersonii.AAC.1
MISVINCADRRVVVHSETGTPQGSSIATACFSASYWQALREYQDSTADDTSELVVVSPFTGSK